jgi:hypothetical protein
MMKKLLRFVGPIALAIGLTGGVLGASTAGASTTNGKNHHPPHHSAKPHHHPHQNKKS